MRTGARRRRGGHARQDVRGRAHQPDRGPAALHVALRILVAPYLGWRPGRHARGARSPGAHARVQRVGAQRVESNNLRVEAITRRRTTRRGGGIDAAHHAAAGGNGGRRSARARSILPHEIEGARLRAIDYMLPYWSAQVIPGLASAAGARPPRPACRRAAPARDLAATGRDR